MPQMTKNGRTMSNLYFAVFGHVYAMFFRVVPVVLDVLGASWTVAVSSSHMAAFGKCFGHTMAKTGEKCQKRPKIEQRGAKRAQKWSKLAKHGAKMGSGSP